MYINLLSVSVPMQEAVNLWLKNTKRFLKANSNRYYLSVRYMNPSTRSFLIIDTYE
ncbi:MAG: hypothetical protein K2J90_13960 [Lachnospiraceae bacterium]|nr:hypothetical protein [Lachnospiraceae bacterium]